MLCLKPWRSIARQSIQFWARRTPKFLHKLSSYTRCRQREHCYPELTSKKKVIIWKASCSCMRPPVYWDLWRRSWAPPSPVGNEAGRQNTTQQKPKREREKEEAGIKRGAICECFSSTYLLRRSYRPSQRLMPKAHIFSYPPSRWVRCIYQSSMTHPMTHSSWAKTFRKGEKQGKWGGWPGERVPRAK